MLSAVSYKIATIGIVSYVQDENVQEAEGDDHYFAVSIFGGKPAVQKDTRNNTNIACIAGEM